MPRNILHRYVHDSGSSPCRPRPASRRRA